VTSGVWLTVGMFGGLLVAIFAGVPLGFALGGIAVITALVMWGITGATPAVYAIFNYMWMVVIIAVPLFVFMGIALQRSAISEELFDAFLSWFGRVRGGLAVVSCWMAAVLSAMVGNCAGSTVTTGIVALPAMKKQNYSDYLKFGSVGSAGSMGILIPPSIPLILIGMASGVSIPKLFAGGMTSGLFVVVVLTIYILLTAWIRPKAGPGVTEKVSFREKIGYLFIVVAVLGTIFGGIATPTEAAAAGAAAVAISVAIRRRFTWEFFKTTTKDTAVLTGMILWITFGSATFVTVYAGGGGGAFVYNLLLGLEVNRWVIFVIVQAIVLFLGMFVDPVGIILICVPIFYPVMQALGFDLVWFSIIFTLNLCIGMITPPFGYNLYYIKTLSPETNIGRIFRSMAPFIVLMLVAMLIITLVPEIALWFPSVLGY
jgi:tripartite ATP-independent transporter DctM subunit